MARGELGTRVLGYLRENSGPQTVKKIKDGLSASSGGAIGYALDKLIGEGQVTKLEGRPARYQLRDQDGSAPPVAAPQQPTEQKSTPRPRKPKGNRDSPSEESDTDPYPDPEPDNDVIPQSKRPCGFCMESKPREYHVKYCPMSRVERGDQISKQARSCSCYISDHDRASDHQEYLRSLSDDAPIQTEESRSFRCGCCGNDVIAAGPICTECQEAECTETIDASGDSGYWNCQIKAENTEDVEKFLLEDSMSFAEEIESLDEEGFIDRTLVDLGISGTEKSI